MSEHGRHSPEEHAAASAVASLKNYKRSNEISASSKEVDMMAIPIKKRKVAEIVYAKPEGSASTVLEQTDNQKGGENRPRRELLPYPFFYYRDYSLVEDDDPLTPLTPPGRVPNFPAKMHAILSRPELADIISWAPHGRAFRVLRPRHFEVRIIPSYFDHAKFSSFVRQANGWGFRRITQGPDRSCYYHEMFLRGIPHLCKKMKRPGASGKPSADPDLEPDLHKISEMYPVGEAPKTSNCALSLPWTVKGGSKARAPVYTGLSTAEAPDTVFSSIGGTVVWPIANTTLSVPLEHRPSCDGLAKMVSSPLSGNLDLQCASTSQSREQHDSNEGGTGEQTGANYKRSASTHLAPSSSLEKSPTQTKEIYPGLAQSGSSTPWAQNNHEKIQVSPPNLLFQTQTEGAHLFQHDPMMSSQYAAGFAAASALTQNAIQAMVQQALSSIYQSQRHNGYPEVDGSRTSVVRDDGKNGFHLSTSG